MWAHLAAQVQGTVVPFTDENIEKCTDMAKVNKYYKLNGALALDVKGAAAKRAEAEVLVLGAMALRGL